MNLTAIMKQTFDAVNRHSVEGILANWIDTGTYDNPTVGPPAVGMADLRRAMTTLVGNVKAAGIQLRVDRTTEQDDRVVAEWHVEPRDGRSGVHVAQFNSAGKLIHVRVYPRAS